MNKIKQAFLHLRDNRGDEHTARMIWVAIAFLTGAILFSVVFASISGPMYNWFDNLNEDLYVDGSDGEYEPGTPGGDYGGSGGGTPDAPVAPPDVDIISSPGLYDHSGMLIYTWDELIARGYLSVFEDILTPGTNVMPAGKLVCKDVIKTVGLYAFANQTNLTSIIFGDSVVYISDNAFSGLSTLSSVRLPASLAYIGTDAFSNCTNLSNITYGGTQEQWRAMTREAGWNTGMPHYVVHCIDGSIYPIILQLIENATITPNYPTDVGHGEQAELFFTAMNDYSLPATITVLGAEYTWDLVSGKLTITNPSDFVYVYISGEKTGCRVVFDANTGTVDPTFKRVVYNLPYGTLPTPVKTGYNFVGWFTAKTGGSEVTAASLVSERNDHTVYAHWTPKTDTPYTVHHYYMNLDGSYPSTGEVQSLKGTTDATVTPAVVGKTGFTSPTTQTVTIKPDGSTVVKYYYTRNWYTVSLNKGTGITGVSGAGTYYYGETVTINATVKTGYTWKSWNGTVTSNTQKYVFAMPANNLNLTANATARTDITYTVYHYYMGLDGKYPATGEAMTYTGTTDTQVTAPLRGKTGFTSPATQTVTIKGDGSTVVKYYYSRNQYTVTVNKGTGIASVTGGGTYYYGASVTINATLITGYKWSKWSGTHSTTTQKYTFTMPANNVNDTANATANTYTVVYNGNGNTGGSTANSTHVYDTAKTLTANGYTKTGYTFIGWATTDARADAGTVDYADKASVKNLTATANGTVTLYAVWKANTYTVTYNGNGNTGGSTANSVHTYDVAKALTTNGFTKTGYTFIGWATTEARADAGTVDYADKASVKNLTATANGTVTLYAVWKANTYSNYIAHWMWGFVNSEGNNSSKDAFHIGNVPFNGTYGQSFVLDTDWAAEIPNGFYLNSVFGTNAVTGSWKTYAMGTAITQVNNGMGFEFDYYPYTYTITYNLDGGTNNAANPNSYNVLYGVTLANPTKAGYTFDGWYIGNTKVTGINVGANATFSSVDDMYAKLASRTTGNITLTAKWKVNQYTLVIDKNDGSAVTTVTQNYGSTYTVPTPTRNGYTFAGWTLSGSGSVSGSVYTFGAGNGSLKANWTTNTITITLNPAPGSGGTTKVYYKYGINKYYSDYACTQQITAITRPTRAGYTFVNYHGDGTSGGLNGERYIAYDSVEFAGDLCTDIYKDATFSATWTPNTYTLNYITPVAGTSTNISGIVPNGYTILEYITSSGTQWIDSGVSIAGNTWVDVDLMWTSAFDYNMMFGAWADVSASLRSANVVCAAGGGGQTQNVGSTTAVNVKYNIKIGADKGYTQNGTKYSLGSTTNAASGRHILLFAASDGSTVNNPYAWSSYGVGRIYGMRIYNGSTLVRNFIPCKNASGTIGMYDLVEGKFYTNKGTGTFTAGPTIGSSTTITYTPATNLTINAAPSATGYTFGGWKVQSSTNGSWTNGATFSGSQGLGTGKYGNAVLVAQWTINSYTLTVNPNGGSWNGSTSSQSATQNYKTTKSIPNPTRTGYTFTGWSLSGGGSLSGTTYTYGAGNATLTANWTPNVYTVTLNNQSASVAGTTAYYYQFNTTKTISGVTCYYYTDSACTSPLSNGYYISVPKRAGYTFGGYYTGTNGSGTQYVDSTGQCVNNIFQSVAGNTTLYAKWNASTYTYAYNANGGSGSIANQTPAWGTTFTLSSGFSRTGWTFNGYYVQRSTDGRWVSTGGWATDAEIAANGWTKSYYQPGEQHNINSSWVDPYIGSATFTFYAQWTAIPYTLDINGIWDGVVYGGLEDRGTFDIYINGTLVGNDITDYYNTSMTYGDTYQITDVKRQSAKYQRYAAQDVGAQSGSITGDTNVMLSFVPAYYTITSKATYDSTWHTGSDTGNMEYTYIGINGTEMPDASRVTFDYSNPTDIWTYPYGTTIGVAVADKYNNDGGAHSYITWNGTRVAGKASYAEYAFVLSSDIVIHMEYNAWLTGISWNLDDVRVAYWNCYITSTERDYYVP